LRPRTTSSSLDYDLAFLESFSGGAPVWKERRKEDKEKDKNKDKEAVVDSDDDNDVVVEEEDCVKNEYRMTKVKSTVR
jgi:hypothetical protein